VRIKRSAKIFFPLLAVVLVGCNTASFYRQAIHGQLQILTRQKSIDKLLAEAQTPAPLKEKLQLVLKLRAFAETQLKLPANGHYLRYADVQRPYVVWNVHAAPEFSLTSKSWWYPIVGKLTYRGYFSEPAAQSYAAKLAHRGADVYVEGVEAYSTLGWFKDPVLNTFIHHDDFDLAGILFHELAHQRIFISGDTDFNEAFATAVEEESVRRWLAAAGDAKAAEEYRIELERKDQFVRLVMRARRQLESLYAQLFSANEADNSSAHPDASGRKGAEDLRRPTGHQESSVNPSRAENVREQKQLIIAQLRHDYEQLKASWSGYAGYDHWFAQSLNNAQLNTVATYYHLVPAFQRLLQANDGDLERFYRDVRALDKVAKAERHLRLQKLLDSK
jgi:predicted aminopeptidase